MLIGKRINDRYKIIEYIGGGGMANVYLARDMILERDVAVKVLRLDLANDDELIRRFHREAQSATSLVHPNIVNIYDVGEEDNIYYIVMEYVDGETLKQYIQNHFPIPIEKVIDITLQITSAISHAHQNNIIHRDIKPQNILIDKKGNVKITDFGIAVALTSTTITQTNSVLGTVHYISPEQARGGVATKKSDIYSLGIVLFELLTGRLPFSGESAVSIALKHLQTETPHPRSWNPSIPQSVENIILKATAKDPFYRYDDIEEFKADLLTCLDPSRINEPPFVLPVDEEATKVIPIIKEPKESKEELKIDNDSGKDKGKKDKKKKKGNKQKRKKWPFVLIFTSLLIILMGILVLTTDVFGAKDVKVPDVRNMKLDDAIKELEKANFVIGDTIEKPDDKIRENYVIKTNPKAGSMKAEGSKITIYVSTGKETIEMEDYRGEQFDEVQALLTEQELNFKSIEVNEEYSDKEAGIILDQNPAPGKKVVPEDTDLVFTVSKGDQSISLKDLTNYSTEDLNYYMKATGINITTTEQYHDTIPKGNVISQDVKPGTSLKKGATVHVVVSKGKEEKPPKTVTIDISVVYTGNPEEKQVQHVQIFIDDMNHDFSVPYETFDMTETTRKRFDLVIQPNSSGRYKVVIDNQVVQDQVVPYE